MDSTANFRNLFSGPRFNLNFEPPKSPDFSDFASQFAASAEGDDATDAATTEAGSNTEGQATASLSGDLSSVVQAFLAAIQEMGIETTYGTDGDDELTGWSNSAFVGGGGNDMIKAWSDSVVDAGSGDDTVYVWSGSAVDAGDGDDTVFAGHGSHVSGAAGNDRIDVFSGTADGGEGDDEIHSYGETKVSGGAGNDRINVGGDSFADGGDGDDTIYALWNTVVDGGSGDDVIKTFDNSSVNGGTGDDSIWAGSNSLVTGGSGDDYIFASGGSVVSGGTGDDKISVLGEDATVQFNVGDGHDQIKLGAGGTIQLGAGLNPEDAQLHVEGNIATVKFAGSDDWIEVQMRPDHPVNVVFDNGETIALEPDDEFKAAFAAAKAEVQERLHNGEAVALGDYPILLV